MTRYVDIRSDTVTRPTPGMLEAMLQAQVGDDVFGEDPTVNELQSHAASLFGKEAALFFPTGTMANQAAIKAHTRPGDEVICDHFAHIYRNESGGIAALSGASVRLLEGHNGRFGVDEVAENINPGDDAHRPWTKLVALENTVNRGGGGCWDLEQIERIRLLCSERGLSLHLDGARLFNALVARGEAAQRYGHLFDTISICLSKGLGAPAGSLLLASKEFISRAHRCRKLLGGGMRQAGYLAAAGLYALKHQVTRLTDDHLRAKATEGELHQLAYVADILPVETNIVIFQLVPGISATDFLGQLRAQGILAGAVDDRSVRFVFHLDVHDEDLESLRAALRSVTPTKA